MSTVDRFRRVDDLFRAAVRLAPGERAEYLAEQCGADAALRAEVIALLAEDQTARGALDRPALGHEIDLHALLDQPDRETPLPATIGKYRIIAFLGAGGMGAVYEAEQDQPRRRVALKVIRSGVISPSLLRRFRHEAQMLGQLKHPGIAQIYEAGTADDGEGGKPFFAMELIGGEPIVLYADQNQLSSRQRLELVACVADAVHHAHSRGVIHRDLKPANILVDEHGQPKILDFGVARATDADVQAVTLQTSIGQLVGTVAYMSPEQASGDPSALDIRSDVYALGVILYELLAGRLPYPVREHLIHEAVRIIREDEPSHLSSINRTFRGDVETIVSKALEKDPNRRYQSAAELAGDIRRHLRDETIIARPASTIYQIRKFARRNKALVGGVAVAFMASVIGTVISIWQAREALLAKDLAETKTLAALDQAARATIASATIAVDQHDPLTARRLLDGIAAERRNWEWRHQEARLDNSLAVIEGEAPFLAAAFTAGGKHVVTVTTAGVIQEWDPFQAAPLKSTSLEETLRAAALSADGAFLAGACGPNGEFVAVWNAATGAEIDRIRPLDDQMHTVAISFDGRRVAAGSTNQLALWSPGTTNAPIIRALNGLPAIGGTDAPVVLALKGVQVIAFSKDGRRVAVGYNPRTASMQDGWFAVFDTATGVRISSSDRYTTFPILALDLDQAGTRVALGHSDKKLCVHDFEKRGLVRAFTGHQAAIRAVALDANAGRLFAASDDATVRAWEIETGQPLAICVGHDPGPASLAVAPAGDRLLAVTGRRVRVWSLAADDAQHVLRGHTNFVYGVAFLDNQRLVSGAWDSTVRVWDVGTRQLRHTWKAPYRFIFGIATSPASNLIAAANDDRVLLLDGATLEPRFELNPAIGLRMTSVSLSADGSRLAGRCMSHVIVWDTARGREITRRPAPAGHDLCAVAISPDGRTLAVDGPKGEVILMAIDSAAEPRRFTGHTRVVCSLAFNRDGTLLASGSRDASARLWDVTTARQLHQFVGHRDNVYALAFSPDQSRLATGSNDTTVRLWDVESGDQVAQLSGHGDYVFALAFSPDGSMLVSGSGDHTLRVWDTQPAHVRWRSRSEP